MLPVVARKTKQLAPFYTIADVNHSYKNKGLQLAAMRPQVKKKIDQAIATAQELKIGAIVNSNVV